MNTLFRVARNPRRIHYRPRQTYVKRSISGPYILFGALHEAHCLSYDFTGPAKIVALEKQTNCVYSYD